eukprot:644238-Rhodomonas_salina.1
MSSDPTVTTVESRVDTARRVGFRKPSACGDITFISALEERQECCFELLQGVDGLAHHEHIINMSAHNHRRSCSYSPPALQIQMNSSNPAVWKP